MSSQYNNRQGGFGGFSLFPPVIKFLLISNIGIFLFTEILFPSLRFGQNSLSDIILKYFALNPFSGINVRMPSGVIEHFAFLPWQVITYMFLHGGFAHLFFNMFALWMFGMELENLWGSKKFLIYYTICGVGAAVANLLISPLFGPAGPTIGASGAIYGILVAFGFIFPNRNIYIYFMIPIKAKYLVIIYMALEVIYLATSSQDGVAHTAHLGGAVVGFIYLLIEHKKDLNLLRNFKSMGSSGFGFTPPRRENTTYEPHGYNEKEVKTTYEEIKADEKRRSEEEKQRVKDKNDYQKEKDYEQQEIQKRIDAILDKLASGGYNSLTEEEKRILFEESKKLR